MASDSSPKAGSNAFKGNEPSSSPALRAEPRKDERDAGRSGVVGRGVRVREFERLPPDQGVSVDMIHVSSLEE